MSAVVRSAKREPGKNRARIQRAATAEFAAHGFSGARTARIARRARVNVRMLYHDHGSKDALYLVVLEEALARSRRIPTMSSPVIGLIQRLLERGQASGAFRRGIDPLRLYVAMVSLAHYSKAHAHTLSRIFDTELRAASWQQAYAQDVHRMLERFVAVGPAAS